MIPKLRCRCLLQNISSTSLLERDLVTSGRRSGIDYDYTHRRVIDQSARRRRPPGPVDFMAVNDSNRRDRLGAYRLQFNTLWNKRTGDENGPLFDFLLTLRGLVARGLGKDRSSKHAGQDENCSAVSYQRLHNLTYTPEGAARKLPKR
jgi:hypothetical protein